jgi:hypothetical protein
MVHEIAQLGADPNARTSDSEDQGDPSQREFRADVEVDVELAY